MPRFAAVLVVALLVVSTLAVLGVHPVSATRGTSGFVASAGPEYLVTIAEKGLPGGTNWTAFLAGTPHTTKNTSFGVLEGVGAYRWTVLSIPAPMAGNVAGWAPNQSAGTVHVNGGPAYINITFLHGFNVTIHESGLPLGTTWKVTLNGTNHTSTATLLTVILANATYTLSVENPVPGAIGVRYVPATSNYGVTVKGSNISKTDIFTTQFFLQTISSPANGGTISPASGWFNNQSSVPFTATPSTGFQFVDWKGNGTGSFSNANPTQTATLGAPITEIAYFASHYTVTFTESGLPGSTSWSVTVNGSLQTSSTSTITFQETNGTYPYTIGKVSGYVASPPSGSVPVIGGTVNVPISWSPYSYSVTFNESGLPSGTKWSVTLNGVLRNSTTPTIVFSEPNGTYSFTVGVISGFGATPSSGSVTVASEPNDVAISWLQGKYVVTFVESGLPTGTNWTVLLSGSAQASTGISIPFTEANGTFSFTIIGVVGYTATPGAGTVTVNGADVTQPITWSVTKYAVTFDETGLTSTSVWAVSLGGTLQSNVSGPIVFHEASGAYNFSVLGVTGYSAVPATGSLLVIGTPVAQTIVFSKLFAVVVTETGLPLGTSWSVSLNGNIGSANSSALPNQITFQEPNGSYSLVVLGVSDFHVGTYSSVVTVNNAGVLIPLTWSASTYSVTFTESGLPSGTNWSVTLGGSSLYSSSTTITFTVSNGSYSFQVGSVSGRSATPGSGPIHVTGGGQNVAIQFSSSSGTSNTLLGLTPTDWALTVGIIALAAVLLGVLLLQRRRAVKKE